MKDWQPIILAIIPAIVSIVGIYYTYRTKVDTDAKLAVQRAEKIDLEERLDTLTRSHLDLGVRVDGDY